MVEGRATAHWQKRSWTRGLEAELTEKGQAEGELHDELLPFGGLRFIADISRHARATMCATLH